MSEIKQKKRIWVTWEKQIRNQNMSAAVGATLFEIITQHPRYIRYPVNIYKTISIFFKYKPNIIFVQNPSLVLAVLAVIAGKVSGARVIVDAHNSGILPLDGKYALLNKLALLITKYTDTTLVSNRYLSEYINNNGGFAIIMPDPLPDFKNYSFSKNNTVRKEILFICTWANDEPYAELITAALHLDGDIRIYITGNYTKKINDFREKLPPNITLTGYLSDSDYKVKLASCDIVIDLTNRENCLVCGAYEAVAMGKPLILSDTVALKEYFKQGAIFTKNNAVDIAAAIESGYENLEKLRSEVEQLKTEIGYSWPQYLSNLERVLK